MKDQMPNTIIKSSEEKSDKRMSGGLVGSLNVLEFDGTNCDGKIEAIISGKNLFCFFLKTYFKDWFYIRSSSDADHHICRKDKR